MPPGFVFTINPTYLMKFCRDTNNVQGILNRYPGENTTDITNQATYYKNIHGYVNGGTPGIPQL